MNSPPSQPAATDGPPFHDADTELLALLFKTASEHAFESIVVTTAEPDTFDGPIVFVNEAFTRMTGYTAEEILGQPPSILQGPRTERAVLDQLKRDLAKDGYFHGRTYNYRKDGSEFLLEWKIAPVRNRNGEITHYVSVQRDVTGEDASV